MLPTIGMCGFGAVIGWLIVSLVRANFRYNVPFALLIFNMILMTLIVDSHIYWGIFVGFIGHAVWLKWANGIAAR